MLARKDQKLFVYIYGLSDSCLFTFWCQCQLFVYIISESGISCKMRHFRDFQTMCWVENGTGFKSLSFYLISFKGMFAKPRQSRLFLFFFLVQTETIGHFLGQIKEKRGAFSYLKKHTKFVAFKGLKNLLPEGLKQLRETSQSINDTSCSTKFHILLKNSLSLVCKNR